MNDKRAMSEFDPYKNWLRIQHSKRPIDHYELLGLKRFETDLAVIEAAVKARVAHIQDVATGSKHVDASQKMLNEFVRARLCLVDEQKRSAYNQKLVATAAAARISAPTHSIANDRTKASKEDSPKKKSALVYWLIYLAPLVLIGGGLIPLIYSVGGKPAPEVAADKTLADKTLADKTVADKTLVDNPVTNDPISEPDTIESTTLTISDRQQRELFGDRSSNSLETIVFSDDFSYDIDSTFKDDGDDAWLAAGWSTARYVGDHNMGVSADNDMFWGCRSHSDCYLEYDHPVQVAIGDRLTVDAIVIRVDQHAYGTRIYLWDGSNEKSRREVAGGTQYPVGPAEDGNKPLEQVGYVVTSEDIDEKLSHVIFRYSHDDNWGETDKVAFGITQAATSGTDIASKFKSNPLKSELDKADLVNSELDQSEKTEPAKTESSQSLESTKFPFKNFAKHFELPPTNDLTEFRIDALIINNRFLMGAKLFSSPESTNKKANFEMRRADDNKQKWIVSNQKSPTEPSLDIACFTKTDRDFFFQWLPTAQNDEFSDYLRNASLKLETPDGQSGWLNLRSPITINEFKLSGDESSTKVESELPWMPHPKSVVVEVLQFPVDQIPSHCLPEIVSKTPAKMYFDKHEANAFVWLEVTADNRASFRLKADLKINIKGKHKSLDPNQLTDYQQSLAEMAVDAQTRADSTGDENTKNQLATIARSAKQMSDACAGYAKLIPKIYERDIPVAIYFMVEDHPVLIAKTPGVVDFKGAHFPDDPSLQRPRSEPTPAGLAVGKPIEATSVSEPHAAKFANDGETANPENSWWSSDCPASITVDLEQEQSIHGFQVYPYFGDERHYQYTIEVSADKKSWTEVVDMSRNVQSAIPNGHLHNLNPTTPAGHKCRYVRLNMLKNSANEFVHLVEFKIFDDEKFLVNGN